MLLEKKCLHKISGIILVFLCGLQIAFTQNVKSGVIGGLKLNEAVEKNFTAGNETHKYQITLSTNQYANLEIEQRGLILWFQILSPDGKIIAEATPENISQNLKKIEFVAEKNGVYEIEIAPYATKKFAGKYQIRLTETRAATGNEKILDEAGRQYFEIFRENNAGNFDKALELARRVSETREKLLGANQAAAAADADLWMSRLYIRKNNLAESENFARRAAEAIAKNYGAESLKYADALSVSAQIRQAQSNFAEAETLYLKALGVREKLAGADSAAAADSLGSLGVLYRAMNDYVKAEQNFAKALMIYENSLGVNRLETAILLNNFGMFYYGSGSFEKALTLLQRSLAVKENTFPEVHRQVGIAYNNLGLIAWKKGDYEKARNYYLRALKIFETVNGTQSDSVANILGNLAIIYKEFDGNLAKSEEFFKRALAINEKNVGEFHQATADFASSLALLYRRMGDTERAEKFGLRALAIYEKVSGEYNHYTMLAIQNLVRIYIVKGDSKRAYEYAKRLSDIHEKVIPLNLRIGSEEQKMKYYNFTERFDKIVTLHANSTPDNALTRDLAFTAVLRHKGRVMDAVSENLSALHSRFNANDRKLLDDLSEINSRLSKSMLSSPQKKSAEERQKQIENLEAEREKLETEISRQSAGFYQPSKPVTLEAVRAAIPADAALIEFAVYRPFDWNAESDEKGYGKPHYIAYIARPTGKIEWKDLGETESINRMIDEFRKSLRDPNKENTESLARDLNKKLMSPISALIGDARHLLISPDGDLNLTPFEALIDEQGRYLIEKYSFSYLGSGRDLLRIQTPPPRTGEGKSVIIANPLFGASAKEQTADSPINKNSSRKPSITATRNISDTYFAPLAGTLSEARSIQKQFPDAQVLSGTEADEDALKKTNAPHLLHIATHGFFLEDKTEPDKAENPLLRSGLAFAGANRGSTESANDGILTALEASGLNLWGTKLVVLSACDTGIGDVKNGEGVYGLRRAFTLAGTESLVMSLWAVSDYATRELMTDYYKNLKNGIGRGEALRAVKLAMMKKKGREHPFYWAGFIQSGEWANLEGKR